MGKAKISRRTALTGIGAGLGAALIVRPALAGLGEPRELRLYNAHTGETFRDAYHNGEGYIAQAWSRLNALMRDHHTDVASEMDPRLFDILWHIHRNYHRVHGRFATLNIHSAYRTEETNERLRSEGAAQNSFHKFGRAVDISAQGFGIYFLYDMVQGVGAGGTGVYMRSQFAHLDTGPRRSWIQPLW